MLFQDNDNYLTYERYANACMVIVRLITHVTHTNVPFFDLSPKFMIRSRVNLDASKANLSCEIKRLFVV